MIFCKIVLYVSISNNIISYNFKESLLNIFIQFIVLKIIAVYKIFNM